MSLHKKIQKEGKACKVIAERLQRLQITANEEMILNMKQKVENMENHTSKYKTAMKKEIISKFK